MPKEKSTKAYRLRNFVIEFGESVFSTDNFILFCKICDLKVASEKRFSIIQHLKTDKHIRSAARLENNKTNNVQQLVTNQKLSEFNSDLCKTLLSANIPLYKLKNTHLKSFLEKYMQRDIPDESTLRKYYVNDCYNQTMDKIGVTVQDQKIWVSIDETTDSNGRYVANVIIGTLEIDCPGEIMLLTSEMLEKVNHSTIAKLFDRPMALLWPNGVQHDDVLLFVSDAAPYMVKSASVIKVFYSKMVHITCLAHGLHRVAEEVRNMFPKVDKLISNVKKTFLKAPYRVQIFKNEAPEIMLPPEPIITRWGTWLDATDYYCKHIQSIRNVFMKLDDDSASILKVKNILDDQQLDANLVCITANFEIISKSITQLEKRGLKLVDSINILNKIIDDMNIIDTQSKSIKSVVEKLKKVIERNKGFNTLRIISNILNGTEENIMELGDLNASEMVNFKYAPITSVDIERSFSQYKNLLTDKRRSLLFENIKEMSIIQCNSNLGKALQQHVRLCGPKKPILPVMPMMEGEVLRFNGWPSMQHHLFAIYADFEALLEKQTELVGASTDGIHAHHPMSYGYFVKAALDVPVAIMEKYDIPQAPLIYRGSESRDEVAKHFVVSVNALSIRLANLLKATNVPISMSVKEVHVHNA
ncbi:hypothetical protein QTP88_004693 [Uroleucon formosanum]